MATHSRPNPFAGGGVAVVGQDFTDRADERAELVRALGTPRGHVVVTGPRRIGKTSLLLAVADDLRRKGRPVLYVDLWSASTLEDVTTRLAREAAEQLGRTWSDLLSSLGRRLQLTFEVATSADGRLVPVPKVTLRDAPAAQQRTRLVETLDLLESLAAQRKTHLAVILDEFQELERLGADERRPAAGAMRQVRAAVQRHAHVTYAFAGSDRAVIDRLHRAADGPLHNFARRLEIGPIEPDHFARWIEAQCERMGLAARGLGAEIVAIAGPRTRDIRALAESVAEASRVGGRVTPATLVRGLEHLLRQRSPDFDRRWKDCTAHQQNVLRAVAAEGERLTRGEVIARFGLGDTSLVAKAVRRLVALEVLLKDGSRVSFDDPFFRAWVVQTALPDVGLTLPVTHVAGRAPAVLPEPPKGRSAAASPKADRGLSPGAKAAKAAKAEKAEKAAKSAKGRPARGTGRSGGAGRRRRA